MIKGIIYYLELIVLIILICTVESGPVPDNYTEQSQIDFNFSTRPSMITYSPDQNSVAYVPVQNGTYFNFRSSLLQSQQKTVNLFAPIYSMTFDSKSQRLYVVKAQSTSLLIVHYFTIANGKINDSNYTLCNISIVRYGKSSISISREDKIAISSSDSGSGQFYILLLSDTKTSAVIESAQTISDPVTDVQWHPTQRQTFLYGVFYQPNKNGYFGRYNCTSKQIISCNSNATKGVAAMLADGSVFLQSDLNGISAFSYTAGQLGLINQIPSFIMNSLSVSFDRRVFVAWTNMSDVRIYQLVQTQLNRFSKGMLSTNNTTLNDIKARPDFKLIFNQSAASQLTFAGISADGNEVYFYKGTNKNITRWSRCGDGKYLSNGQCYNCSTICKTCHISATKCTSCPNTSLYSFQACVSCRIKYPGCQSCSSVDCLKCNTTANFNSTPSYNKCYCADLAFPINDGKQCKYCSDVIVGCSICQNSINCTECNHDGHFELNPVSRLCYCVEPYYLKNNKTCESCDVDIKNCNSCATVTGTLLCQSCTKGFSLSMDKKSCIDCYQISPGCINCGDTITCSQCDTDNSFVKNGTKCSCIQNFVPSQQKCVPCTSLFGCSTCSDLYTCSKCVQGTGLVLQNGKCKCSSGSAFDGKSCIPCTQIIGCLSCLNGQSCTQCDQGNNFQLSTSGQCQCKTKYWLNGNKCESCSVKFNFCATCSTDGKECLSCEYSQQKLNENKTACVCQDFKFLDQNKNCQSCDTYQKCIHCQNVNSCTQCDTKKYYNTTAVNGQCQCQAGYVQQNNACVICNVKGCSLCPSFNNCTKCMTEKKFSVDPVNNLCVCKTDTFLNDQKTQCFSCGQKMYGCTNCTSLTRCTTCDSSKNLKVNSVQTGCTCMDNYYLKDNDCLKCSTFVQNCAYCYQQKTSVRCDICNIGFIYNETSNKCYCPDGYDITGNQQCIKKQDDKSKDAGGGVQLWQMLVGFVVLIIVNGALSYAIFVKCRKAPAPSQPQLNFPHEDDHRNYNQLINATDVLQNENNRS